jgi:perosamine synthetase
MNVFSTRPYFSEPDVQAISVELGSILRSGRLILGPYLDKLEEAFKEYCGVKQAVAVSTCTAALEICLRYLDVKSREVIIPTNTFIATGNAVIYSGGTPVLGDIKPDTLCLDPGEVLKRITPKTKGVIVVHVGGLLCPDIEEIERICGERGLFLIEDAAHAHGATFKGKKSGSIGFAGCFSFYPTKVMTTCTGGMLTTNDEQLAEYARSLRHYGVGQGLHHIVNLGDDWLMDEISALLGIYQLKALDNNIARRNEVARKYTEAMSNFDGIETFKVPSHILHSYYKYPLLLPKTLNKKTLVEKIQSQYGISIGSIYDPPCHLQPVYQRLFGFYRGMLPVAEDILERTFCLPMYPQMTEEEINYVINSLKSVIIGCYLTGEGLAREQNCNYTPA